MVMQIGTLGRYFLKMDEISLSLKGNQLTVFVANDNFQVSSKGENLIHMQFVFIISFYLTFPQLSKLKARNNCLQLSDSSHMVFII